MDPSITVYVIAGVLFIGLFVLSILKGVIKTILLGGGLLGAIVAYYWFNRNGYAYLSFLTSNPREWMVTGVAWLASVFIFGIFTHGMFWFSNVFSLGSKIGWGGPKGILTTVLMFLTLCWTGSLGIFYYGDVADIKRARRAALVEMGTEKPRTYWFYSWKTNLCSNPKTSWLLHLNPMDDPERVALAKLVAYLASFDLHQAETKYMRIASCFPYPRRIRSLVRDKGIRTMVERNDMAGLMNHPELTKILTDDSMRVSISRFPVDQFLANQFPGPSDPSIPTAIPLENATSQQGAVPPPGTTVNPIQPPVKVVP